MTKPLGGKVAVIGAGSAGLAALQQLLEKGFRVTVFERRSQVGGVWNYEEPGKCEIMCDSQGKAFVQDPSQPQGCFASAMYEGLRTNIPSALMSYRDFPFPPDTATFPTRETVNEYLHRFAREQDLERHILFDTLVRRLERVSKSAEPSRWRIQFSSTSGTPEVRSEEFDCVVVSNGRCNKGSLPMVEGLDRFRGEVLHTSFYRTPLIFSGKTVLVVGNASSGSDVCRELVGKLARSFEGSSEWSARASSSEPPVKVYQSVRSAPILDYDPRNPDSPEWTKRIHVLPPISKIDEPDAENSKGVIHFVDGTILRDVDVLVFGTGFLFDMPFLDQTVEPFLSKPLLIESLHAPFTSGLTSTVPSPKPEGGASRLHNLDDWQLFYAGDSSLAILGSPNIIVPFPLTQAQARVVASVWSGETPAPPPRPRKLLQSDPRRWDLSAKLDEGEGPDVESLSGLQYHNLGWPADFAYIDGLVQWLGGQKPDPKSSKEGWNLTPEWRKDLRQKSKALRRAELGY